MRRLAPGLNSDSIRLRQPRLDPLFVVVDAVTRTPGMEVQTAVAEQFQQNNKRSRRLVVAAAVVAVCLVGAAIAVGVTFGVKKNSDASSATPSTQPLEPFIVDCSNLQIQAQPDPVTQCHCAGSISVVTGGVAARYITLNQTLMPTVDPSFHDAMQSCSPQNQALVWLATDNGDSPTLSESALRQRYNLALLFILWNGPGWQANDGWLSSHDECVWYGITCNDQMNVTDISLSNNTMSGQLASAISSFADLISLELDGNQFNGSTLTSLFGEMSNLQKLQLNLTGINGTIPHELFNLTERLQYVNLAGNELSGTIPTLVGKLKQLRKFLIWSMVQLN